LTNLETSAAVIITRPPEIIACLKLRLSTRNVFIIFDSHPRPDYPNGAGAIVSSSVEGTARRLTELLPSVDLQDGILQWQAQLLSNCSGHVFVPHSLDTSTTALWQAVLESSLAQLSMQAEISELRSQHDFQASEQKRLESELKEVEERCQRQERTIQELRSSASNARTHHTAVSQWSRPFTGSPSSNNRTSTGNSSSNNRTITGSPSSNNPFLNPNLSRLTATSHSTSSRSAGSRDTRGSSPAPLFDQDDNLSYARHLQGEFDSEDHALSAERNTISRYTTSHFTSSRSAGPHDTRGGPPAQLFDREDGLSYAERLQSEFDNEDRALSAERTNLSRYTTTSHSTNSRSAGPHDIRRGPPAPLFDRDDGLSYAKRLQSVFDNEDRALSAERVNLSHTVQRVFECGICMEEMPEDSVARPDPCKHSFCRECMRGYVSARLEEHRFPILCPTCTASKGKGKEVTGGTWMFSSPLVKVLMNVVEVSQSLALNLGLTDEQFNIWTEMEMVSFSVLLHCRKYGTPWPLPVCLLIFETGVSGRCS
jgi:hypothetical protein